MRNLLNEMLGMKKDEDIKDVELATSNEVKRYEINQDVLPTEGGFRITLQRGFNKTEWHLYLEEAFIDEFERVYDLTLLEHQRDIIAMMFTDRVNRLRKKLMAMEKVMDADTKKARKERADSMGRRNVRRVNVSPLVRAT